LPAQQELAAAVQWTELFWNRLWDEEFLGVNTADKPPARLGLTPKDVWLQVPSVQVE
jgi:hypothetical protein